MKVNWNIEQLVQSPRKHSAPGFERPGVEACFFENVPYRGKPTRIFAWIGLPYLEPGATCPGIVLLHGGGGTAFDEWVRIWNRRGYAAITFDQCGCLPEMPKPSGGVKHERHEDGGPPGWDYSFEHIRDPIEDQWPYHAVAAAIRAHSLLAALPQVDENRIGITGISWGGYLTGLAAAVDPRLKCAVPVYGCGFLGENSAFADNILNHMDRDDADRWLDLWDPSHYLPETRIPFCWVSGTNDIVYPLDSLAKSYRLTDYTACIRVEMRHSHPDGWAPEETGVFVDGILSGGAPLPRIVESEVVADGTGPRGSGKSLRVLFEAYRPVVKAELNFTRATGYWSDRRYNVRPIDVPPGAGEIVAEIPPQTTVCFINLFDDRGCISSSDPVFPS